MDTSGRVYLDHAATTPALPEVAAVMNQYLTEIFGNPSSLHAFGQEARRALDSARDSVAKAIGADPSEIYFTSGGTESDNLALIGVTTAMSHQGDHIITTAIEHHAVLSTCTALQSRGFRVTLLPVDDFGLVSPDDLRKAITDKTILISIMHANNEIGTIEPIGELTEIAKESGIPFHTDAVQTVGHIPVSAKKMGVDLLSLAAHKFYGPKGIGALFVRRGTRINPIIFGGAQERERRAGTENVPGVLGMAKALEIAVSEMDERSSHESVLRDRLVAELMQRIPDLKLNGHPTLRLPNNANLSVARVEGESMLLNLDMQGIAVSSGSACSSGALEPSHVLRALGLPFALAQASLRFSLGRSNADADIDRIIETLPPIVSRLRSISPVIE